MNGNQLFTKHSAKFEDVKKSSRPGVLASIRGAVTGWKSNRNGRTYSRDLWVKALDSEYVKEQVALNHFVGEADHPEERLEPIIQNMSHAMRDFEFHDDTQEVWATIDILDTPCGNMLKTLYDYSGALSFSTRGSGDVMDNGEVDPDTYQLFAIDAVLRPSYPTATVTELLTESEILNKNKDVKKVLEAYSGKDKVFKPILTEDFTDEEVSRGNVNWKRLQDEIGVSKGGYFGKVTSIMGGFGECKINITIANDDWMPLNQYGSPNYPNYFYTETVKDLIHISDEELTDTINKINKEINRMINKAKREDKSKDSINESKQLNEYGDTKDHSSEIEELFLKWFKERTSLGVRFWQSMSMSNSLDVTAKESGEGSDRKIVYTVVNNSPFVEVEEWADEIGQYIANNVHIKYNGFTYNDKSFFSGDETAGDITWTFTQQIGIPDFGAEFESVKAVKKFSKGALNEDGPQVTYGEVDPEENEWVANFHYNKCPHCGSENGLDIFWTEKDHSWAESICSECGKVVDPYIQVDGDNSEDYEDDDSFTMYNQDYDKSVRVWKQDGKWYDEEGNRYMGYLSKQDVKSYFKGNWIEESKLIEEADDSSLQSPKEQMDKSKNKFGEFKPGDHVQIEDTYSYKYFGDYEVVREMTPEEQAGIYGYGVQGYILKNVDKNSMFAGQEIHSNNYRMKLLSDNSINESSNPYVQNIQDKYNLDEVNADIMVDCIDHIDDYIIGEGYVLTKDGIDDYINCDLFDDGRVEPDGFDDKKVKEALYKYYQKELQENVSLKEFEHPWRKEVPEDLINNLRSNYAGKTISKSRDKAEQEGGLIYVANELGVEDFFDVLKALEVMCMDGQAKEIDDSTYKINESCDLLDDYFNFHKGNY